MEPELVHKLFDAFSIQRWNDQVRPLDLVEMDKHGHKMVIAYCLAKIEENDNAAIIDWNMLVKCGVIELLRRTVLSDIKSPVYRIIEKDFHEAHMEINKWAWDKLNIILADSDFKKDTESYLNGKLTIDPLISQILDAAHFFASYWEWQVVRNISPDAPYIVKLNRDMNNGLEDHLHLKGFKQLVSQNKLYEFVDLIGRLRFQVRWGQALRLPKTSVLGHSMYVACMSYLISLKLPLCSERLKNNFFGGLFHDLPEAVTRDIISPIKKEVKGLEGVITSIEARLMENEVYIYLDASIREEIVYFTANEFASKIRVGNALTITSTEDINKEYNDIRFHPIDGAIIRVIDHLSAYVEARVAIKNGFLAQALREGEEHYYSKYCNYKICNINFGSIFTGIRRLTETTSVL